jgi:hypothetical protein
MITGPMTSSRAAMKGVAEWLQCFASFGFEVAEQHAATIATSTWKYSDLHQPGASSSPPRPSSRESTRQKKKEPRVFPPGVLGLCWY